MALKPPLVDTPKPFNLHARLMVLQYTIVVAFLALGLRFWNMQIVQRDLYTKQAENNRIRELPIPAPRGNILDRNGKILVDSRPTFNILVNREDIENEKETARLLVEEFAVDPEFLHRQLTSQAAKSRPVEVKVGATDTDRAKVAAYAYEHPELTVELQPQRKYPLGKIGSHILGYVHEISPAQLNKPEYADCKPGDKVGQAGLEKSYNKILMGREGKRRIIVDSRGRFVQELEQVPPIPGQDVVTTIDLDLQEVAEKQLEDRGLDGVIVAMDPRNGEILAMASKPGYDPNLFSEGISRADYAQLAQDKHKPLRNRAIQDIYPPGSTWKLVMSVAGIKAGVMTPDMPIVCGGGITIGNKFTRCMGGHGAPKLPLAITKSCDGYYYRLGIKLGLDNLRKWASEMGCGEYTGIDLPNEFKGYIPSLELKAATVRRTLPNATPRDYEWHEIDSVYASIGQAMVRPTPLQMLRVAAGISQRGTFHTPHLLLEARATKDLPAVHFQDKTNTIEMGEKDWDAIIEGMWGAVNGGGTAASSAIRDVPGWEMCGKTGTAQVVSKLKASKLEEQDHSWFVGFGPRTSPEIAGISLVEHGGFGAKASAPNIKAVFEAYLKKKRGLPLDLDAPAAGVAEKPAKAKQPTGTGKPTASPTTTKPAPAKAPTPAPEKALTQRPLPPKPKR
ncbi:MAG: penicillin-binding protein 2 [Blastocatellia bacterium]|nr:penicillin-binding protein 2 [Blastocatellia bacterium]